MASLTDLTDEEKFDQEILVMQIEAGIEFCLKILNRMRVLMGKPEMSWEEFEEGAKQFELEQQEETYDL